MSCVALGVRKEIKLTVHPLHSLVKKNSSHDTSLLTRGSLFGLGQILIVNIDAFAGCPECTYLYKRVVSTDQDSPN